MVIDKYLLNHAEPEVAALAELEKWLPAALVWSQVVVIPACNEANEFLRPPPLAHGRSLMILVINQTASASLEVSVANKTLSDAVSKHFEKIWQTGDEYSGFSLLLFKDAVSNRDILLVDKFSQGYELPPKGGVGNARKIGADLATGLIHSKRIDSHWIRCTDADVQLPATYFGCTARYDDCGNISALIYPFQHGNNDQNSAAAVVFLATQLYELSLYYYVAAFRSVGSPYAFHTIGSTIAINVEHYAKVRGFPKREAGEDFYLLNKLAKSGRVLQLEKNGDCQPIEIDARLSDRVPFGTGAAVNKMTALDDVMNDYRFYDPRVFGLLGLWLESWPTVWRSQSSELKPEVFAGLETLDLRSPAPQKLELRCLLEALHALKTRSALQHAFRQSKNLEQFERQMYIWFDAFRSLKLIHALRDRLLPSINFGELSDRSEFEFLLTQDADFKNCHDALVGRSK